MNIFYKIILIIFFNGITALLSQVILFKEILTKIYANELVLSFILGFWLLVGFFTSNYIYKRFLKNRSYNTLIYLLSFLPIIGAIFLIFDVFFIRYSKVILNYPPELLFNIYSALILIFIIVFPVNMVLTLVFLVGAEILKRENAYNYIKYLYILESAGAMIAGIIYTIFLSKKVFNLDIAYWIGILNIALIYILFREKNKQTQIIEIVLIFTLIFYLIPLMTGLLKRLNEKSINVEFEKYETIIYNKELPTGKITITKNKDNYYVFFNNLLQYKTNSIKEKELIGFSYLLNSDNSKNILLINGGFTGGIKELLQYKNIKKISYIENDEYLAEVLEKFFKEKEFKSKKIKYIYGDTIYYFLKVKPDEKYDNIIILFPYPSTIFYNRYYTEEFYKLLKKYIKSDGIISFSLPGGENYIDEATLNSLSSIYKTLKNVFKNVYIIPGDNTIFLASDKKIILSVKKILNTLKKEKLNIPLFNKKYLEYKLNSDKINKIKSQIEAKNTKINKMLFPYSYMYFLHKDIFMFKDKRNILKVLILLLIFWFIISNSISLSMDINYFKMFILGFSSMVIELSSIFLFQSFYGYIYQGVGLLFSFFMLGIIIGGVISYLFDKELKINHFLFIGIILSGLMIFYILSFKEFIEPINPNIIIFFMVFSGIITGGGFNILVDKAEVSILYGMDLLGGVISSIAFGLFLLPFLGFINTLILNIILLLIFIILRTKQ